MAGHFQKISQIGFSAIRAMAKDIAELENQGHQVVKLTQGLPSFDTPNHIKAAAIKALERGETQYCPNLGLPKLRQAIKHKLKHDNGLSYLEDEIMVTNGVSEAIFITLTALLDKDDEVLLFEPVFAPYENGITLSFAKTIKVPTYAENNYLPQINDIQAQLSEKSKILVLINPVNPTGAVFSIELLEKITQLVVENDLIVIADEIYEKIIFDGAKHHSIAKLPLMRERTVVLNGFSKFYGMSGWRLGYIATDINLMQSILKVQQNCAVCANTFTQYGGVEALTGPQEVCYDQLSILDEQRKLLCKGLDSIDYLRYVRPLGALYIYAKIENIHLNAYQLCDKLLKDHHVAIVPWNNDHVRLSFTANEQALLKGVYKLSQLVFPS